MLNITKNVWLISFEISVCCRYILNNCSVNFILCYFLTSRSVITICLFQAVIRDIFCYPDLNQWKEFDKCDIKQSCLVWTFIQTSICIVNDQFCNNPTNYYFIEIEFPMSEAYYVKFWTYSQIQLLIIFVVCIVILFSCNKTTTVISK